jgi:hypothetical protein
MAVNIAQAGGNIKEVVERNAMNETSGLGSRVQGKFE